MEQSLHFVYQKPDRVGQIICHGIHAVKFLEVTQIVASIATSNSSVFYTPPSSKIARVTWSPHPGDNNQDFIRTPNGQETLRQRLHISVVGVVL